MPELLVSCQELSKAFGAAPLFEGLSLGVFEGDHVGLVGPNGSGKSTLLKILAGLEEPSSGTRAARKRLRIGYVPQDPVFDADTTVGSVLLARAAQTSTSTTTRRTGASRWRWGRPASRTARRPRRPSPEAGRSGSPSRRPS